MLTNSQKAKLLLVWRTRQPGQFTAANITGLGNRIKGRKRET